MKNAKTSTDLNVSNALKAEILRSIAPSVPEIMSSTMVNASVVPNKQVA